MLPLSHLILSSAFALILFLLFPQIKVIGLLLIIFSGVLIDFDHYLYYIFEKKDFSVARAYNWYVERSLRFRKLSWEERKKLYYGFFFFHGTEVLILLFLLGIFFFPILLFVCIGILFHLFLDIVFEVYTGGRNFDRLSVIYSFLKYKKMKKNSLFRDYSFL